MVRNHQILLREITLKANNHKTFNNTNLWLHFYFTVHLVFHPKSNQRWKCTKERREKDRGKQIPLVIWQGEPLQDGQYSPLVGYGPGGDNQQNMLLVSFHRLKPESSCSCTQAKCSLFATICFHFVVVKGPLWN